MGEARSASLPQLGGSGVIEKHPAHALPRACRIKRRPDFTLCYDAGRRFFSRYFVLFVRRKDEGPWRVGFAVTKKIGNAVHRNRLKRVLREFFRLNGHLLPPTVDIVAVPRRDIVGIDVQLSLVWEELFPLLRRVSAFGRGGGEPA